MAFDGTLSDIVPRPGLAKPVPGTAIVLSRLAGRADLQAFAALDQLRAEGVRTVKVAVRSAETPEELVSNADIVVERPAGLVELLSDL
jgi:hypothetical protein